MAISQILLINGQSSRRGICRLSERKRDAIAFGDIGKWEEDREKTAQQIINLKQEQIELRISYSTTD